MRVKCVSNTTERLSKETLLFGYPENYKFDVVVGNIYVVYSSAVLNDGRLIFLLAVADDPELPFWYPAELFQVEESLLPVKFYFGLTGSKNARALWGYKEMVLDPQHYIGLIESEQEALEVFAKRKEEIDEYEELRKSK